MSDRGTADVGHPLSMSCSPESFLATRRLMDLLQLPNVWKKSDF